MGRRLSQRYPTPKTAESGASLGWLSGGRTSHEKNSSLRSSFPEVGQ